MKCPFQGSLVALPTPFRRDEVDFAALHHLIEWHVEKKSDGIVVAGTSGEAVTLSDYERRSLLHATVEYARKRLPVIAGIGTNNTRQSVDFARFAADAHVDGLLAVAPYYNKPTQPGLVAHYSAIAEATSLPLILYNVPGRTCTDLKPETIAECRSRYPHIVAVKEASGSIGRAQQIKESSDIALIAGEDALIAEFMGLGAVGVIGVVANIAPSQVAELCRVARPGGNAVRTAELVDWLAPLIRDLFIETSPTPMKTALAAMKLCGAEVRLPLVAMEAANQERLMSSLHEAGLLRLEKSPAPRG
ncbi:MAG TPA: 4-hydroxy-tetrahydrodipicolinate synthase [Planctomycetota bacterium]|nr:4-hydroxy-tetrahydrodipicolinate synthase [Planctomycetota bacterium]